MKPTLQSVMACGAILCVISFFVVLVLTENDLYKEPTTFERGFIQGAKWARIVIEVRGEELPSDEELLKQIREGLK